MLLPDLLLATALLILIYMTAWWLVGTLAKDNSLVDIAWGPGFILVAWFLLLLSGTTTAAQVLLTVLITIWGTRLAIHIGARKLDTDEDWRYAAMRKKWGKHALWRSYFQVYLLQGLLLLIISLPFLVVNSAYPQLGLHPLVVIGFLVWLKGFWWETVADWQLSAFKADGKNKGKLMTHGVWRYSRHPNYFGESLQWWGFALIALSVAGGWIALLSPLLLTGLLVGVSGVPLLEKRYEHRKDWQAYKAKTSAFIPWLPRK